MTGRSRLWVALRSLERLASMFSFLGCCALVDSQLNVIERQHLRLLGYAEQMNARLITAHPLRRLHRLELHKTEEEMLDRLTDAIGERMAGTLTEEDALAASNAEAKAQAVMQNRGNIA